MGLQIKTFTWEQAMECLEEPEWGRFPFVYAVIIVLASLEFFGVLFAVRRDNRELKFIEALVTGRKKDRTNRIRSRLRNLRRQRQIIKEERERERQMLSVVPGVDMSRRTLRRCPPPRRLHHTPDALTRSHLSLPQPAWCSRTARARIIRDRRSSPCDRISRPRPHLLQVPRWSNRPTRGGCRLGRGRC